MILQELDDGLQIRRVFEDDADEWRPAFTGAYQTIFAGYPYYERYSPAEAEAVYEKLTSTPGNITLLATQAHQVVGFGIAIPLIRKGPVAVELTGLVPIHHTMYLAELGVMESHRGRKLGRVLIQQRLAAMDRDNYSHVVLRVNAGDNPSSQLYKDLGFEDMGVYTEVNSMRTDGRVKTDRRLFLSKVLSQVDARPTSR